MSRIRLLIVDDESLVRQALAGLLALESDFEVVGQAANGAAALENIEPLSPDVVLMDLQMPVMGGVEATRLLRQHYPLVKVLVLTTFDDDALIVGALQAGAHGYLLKDSGAAQICAAIRTAQLGYTALSDVVGEKVVSNAARSAKANVGVHLTAREQQVLALLADGLNNKEIASALSIAEKTVRDHISRILSELNLRDRTQAALWARQNQPGTTFGAQ